LDQQPLNGPPLRPSTRSGHLSRWRATPLSGNTISVPHTASAVSEDQFGAPDTAAGTTSSTAHNRPLAARSALQALPAGPAQFIARARLDPVRRGEGLRQRRLPP